MKLILLCALVLAIVAGLETKKASRKAKFSKKMLSLLPATVLDDEDADVGSGPACTLCEEIIARVIKLAVGKTKDQIKSIIERLCAKLSPAEQLVCKTALDPLVDKLATLIMQGLSAQQICQQVDLCTTFEKLGGSKYKLHGHINEVIMKFSLH